MMKTIGLLGGAGWSSTISYYTLLNQQVNARLGGDHSAKILLRSIDFHDIMSHFGKDNQKVEEALHDELLGLIAIQPDCIIICCNLLHKYYDLIEHSLESDIPVMHAIDLTAQQLQQKNYHKVLLLASTFTMEDGFFENTLSQNGISVIVPNQEERERIGQIHQELLHNKVTRESRAYFSDLTLKYKSLDAVVLGCTELPMVLDQANSSLPIVDPVVLQVVHAVDFALESLDSRQ
ncbi:MAG: amino acid racemase [Alphaproteobacteria bacterium]|nr:amino acid racemase [Alphaproteobacteria bacterium]